ncbi:hypothetical protein MMC07_006614 [Pseudocyphellaria aurata]|nr:hypothetical protein [Pseudocyphellaria aurata]
MAKRALEDSEAFNRQFSRNHNHEEKRQKGPLGLPFTSFNENQLVDVTGSHKWVAPGPKDIRGPCPGLNSLANHGYIPHSGIVPLTVAATATNEVFGLAIGFGTLLSVYATLVDGNIIDDTWSIGGKPPQNLLSLVVGTGDGLSGSHNKYESDASPGRGDYYLYNGDVTSLRVEKFKALYDLAKNDPVPNYNLDILIKHRKFTFDQSTSTNPHFFFGPLSGLAGANAAHTFIRKFPATLNSAVSKKSIAALMSNHSDEYPNGLLDKATLKSFFSVTEKSDGSLSWKPGHERIPDNWYRRPRGLQNDYALYSFALDLLQMAKVVPEAVAVGGNTGTVNSFAGVELADITGGVYHTLDLLNPQKFTCFLYELTLAVVPAFLHSQLLGSLLTGALNLLHPLIDPLVDPSCATIGRCFHNPIKDDRADELTELGNFDNSFMDQFPGAAVNRF